MASMASLLIRISALLIAFLAVCCPASLAAPPLGKRYRVGGPEGWRVPPPVDKEMFYVKWASPITFFVEDSIGNPSATRARAFSFLDLVFQLGIDSSM
jgi:hypothetical protein